MADDDNIRYINSLIPDRDPNLEYGSILPFAVDRTTDETYFAYPEFVRDLVSVFETPARVARGEIQDMDELRQAAADLALTYTPAGGLAGIATGTRGLAMGAARSEKPVIDKFTTGRGSTYELFDDATTQRNRSGVGHKDTSTGLQPVSNKTVFVDKEGLVDVGGIFQNPDIATRLNPVFDDKGNITSMAVDLTEDFGPRRAGERIAEVPVTTQPAVGKYPVEIMSPESPRGSSGRGVHFGSEIIDVQSKTPAEGLSELFYRGSSNLDELAGKYSLSKEGTLGGGGVYVTPDTDYASNYAVQTALGEPKTGGFVAPLNVKFDNPLIIDIKTAQEKVAPELKVLKALGLSDDKAADMLESAYEKTGGLTNQISSRAKKQGFDGIVLRNEDGTIQEAISYNTQNIRSAFEEVIKNPDKDLKKYRSGGSIERNPYNMARCFRRVWKSKWKKASKAPKGQSSRWRWTTSSSKACPPTTWRSWRRCRKKS
jgi:hypothetical protein